MGKSEFIRESLRERAANAADASVARSRRLEILTNVYPTLTRGATLCRLLAQAIEFHGFTLSSR
ncbi:MAG TPA: hypothetical protein VGC91_04455 [Pyrinomonadaceae bacterium]